MTRLTHCPETAARALVLLICPGADVVTFDADGPRVTFTVYTADGPRTVFGDADHALIAGALAELAHVTSRRHLVL